MTDINRVFLIGRLTRDPELRYTGSGIAVSTITIAVNRKKGANGESTADFIDVVLWRKLAELCNQYLSKGKQIAVEGRIQVRSYQTNDGSKRKIFEVVASNIQFLDRDSNIGSSESNNTYEKVEIEKDLKDSVDNNIDFLDLDNDEIPF